MAVFFCSSEIIPPFDNLPHHHAAHLDLSDCEQGNNIGTDETVVSSCDGHVVRDEPLVPSSTPRRMPGTQNEDESSPVRSSQEPKPTMVSHGHACAGGISAMRSLASMWHLRTDFPVRMHTPEKRFSCATCRLPIIRGRLTPLWQLSELRQRSCSRMIRGSTGRIFASSWRSHISHLGSTTQRTPDAPVRVETMGYTAGYTTQTCIRAPVAQQMYA